MQTKIFGHISPYKRKSLGEPDKFGNSNICDETEICVYQDLKAKWNLWTTIYSNTKWDYDTDLITGDGMKELYGDQRYMLFRDDIVADVINDIKKVYTNEYKNKDNWYGLERMGSFEYPFKNDITIAQKIELDSNDSILMIGDIHSSFHSLIEIIEENREYFKDDSLTLEDNKKIIFLGDIVDRGPYSIELLVLAFILKIVNPTSVWIINGNHEDIDMFSNFGLGHEMDQQFHRFDTMIHLIKVLYNLPSVIYLKHGVEWFHLSHGAFSPKFGVPAEIGHKYRYPMTYDTGSTIKNFLESMKKICFLEHDSDMFLDEFKWGDFHEKTTAYTLDPTTNRPQFGVGFTREYLNYNGISCIIGGHQDFNLLALLTSCTQEGAELNICEKKFSYESSDDLFIPKDVADAIAFQQMITKKHMYELHPLDGNVLAIITSTATISRKLKGNAYLEMTSGIVHSFPEDGTSAKSGGKYIFVD